MRHRGMTDIQRQVRSFYCAAVRLKSTSTRFSTAVKHILLRTDIGTMQ